MAFVLQDVIEELEKFHSLDPIKKLKKNNLVEVTVYLGIFSAEAETQKARDAEKMLQDAQRLQA